MPGLQKMYDEMKNVPGLQFAFVSSDDGAEKVSNFMQRKQYNLPVYLPLHPAPAALRAPSIPTTYVISRQGTIIMKEEGMANYNTSAFKNFLREAVKGSGN